MKKNFNLLNIVLCCALMLTAGCGNNESPKTTEAPASNDTSTPAPAVEAPTRGPVINIMDTLSVKRWVLTMKDSAASMERVGLKLGEIYGARLGEVIKKNKLKVTGSPMAWYKGVKAPYFFEAGLPVDKKPSKLPKGVYVKEIGIDSIVVAHFYGPYELLPQAYEALEDWLKDRKKTKKGQPYEIYVGDPMDENGQPNDPYKVQTDIVFHWK